MRLIEIEGFENQKEIMGFMKNYANAVIEEKKVEYNCLFNLYKSNTLPEDKKKELFEYLEFLRSVDGLEFDKDGNLLNAFEEDEEVKAAKKLIDIQTRVAKIEYKEIFELYKTNTLPKDIQKETFEHLEELRNIDGLEFDKDGNLTN